MKYEVLDDREKLTMVEAELTSVEREHFRLTVTSAEGDTEDGKRRAEEFEERHKTLSAQRKDLKTKIEKAASKP